jgi:hypothetical protein
LPSNEKNSSDHHNSYNKGPNLALFSFTESPSNSLPTIKFPKNHITSSYHRNLPKIANAIFVHQRTLGVKLKADIKGYAKAYHFSILKEWTRINRLPITNPKDASKTVSGSNLVICFILINTSI